MKTLSALPELFLLALQRVEERLVLAVQAEVDEKKPVQELEVKYSQDQMLGTAVTKAHILQVLR